MYFRHGVSKRTFGYLDDFAWRRVTEWLLKRHKGLTWREMSRRFLTGSPGNRPAAKGKLLFLCQQVEVTRYRWRGYGVPNTLDRKPPTRPTPHSQREPVERRMRGDALVRCGGRAGETGREQIRNRALARPLQSATRRHVPSGGERPSPPGRRSGPVKLGAA